jgi:uncharacterized damage-inducible protein DinB
MDRAAITEIFDYDEWCWRSITEQCAPLGDELLTKVAPGSGWPALGNCLGHMLYGYDAWLNTMEGAPRVEGDSTPLIPTWVELNAANDRVRGRFRSYLASLSDQSLFSDVEVSVYGEVLAYTPAELLGNLVVHDRGHHGDVNTLLYQLGTDDLGVPDYRWYVNFKRGYR